MLKGIGRVFNASYFAFFFGDTIIWHWIIKILARELWTLELESKMMIDDVQLSFFWAQNGGPTCNCCHEKLLQKGKPQRTKVNGLLPNFHMEKYLPIFDHNENFNIIYIFDAQYTGNSHHSTSNYSCYAKTWCKEPTKLK